MSPIIDNRKQSLYIPGEQLREIREQAARLDRSLSWIVQKAWEYGRDAIKRMPKQE